MAEQCTASNPAIDNGAQCRYRVGHLEADIPHTTPNGLWWRDLEAEAKIETLEVAVMEATLYNDLIELLLRSGRDGLIMANRVMNVYGASARRRAGL